MVLVRFSSLIPMSASRVALQFNPGLRRLIPNDFPGLKYSTVVLKARTAAFKPRPKFSPSFVRDFDLREVWPENRCLRPDNSFTGSLIANFVRDSSAVVAFQFGI